jgi:hyperosmotically inducible periplasmic protein
MNFKKRSATLAVILLSGLSINAMAFSTDEVKDGQTAYGELFSNLDKNNDGVLSKSEAMKDSSYKKLHFSKADVDKDGTLDKEEFAAAKTKAGNTEVKRVASDSWITTEAKSKLLAEESLKSLKISVETHKGEVLLSGFVDNADMKTKAESVVSAIKGVKSVKNSIQVRS